MAGRARPVRPVCFLLIFGALTALMAISFAGAETAAARAETFVGFCDFSGAIQHQPPLTDQPTYTTFQGRFTGTCSGELTDGTGQTRQLDSAPFRYEAQGAGELSCLGGNATGTGNLVFGGTDTIGFSLTEHRVPPLDVTPLQGDAGGSALVVGNLSPSTDLAKASERCSGSGLPRIQGDGHLTSPGISG
jgi:hypothetical protein